MWTGKRPEGQTENVRSRQSIKQKAAKGSIRVEESKYKLVDHQVLRCSKVVISVAYER